MNIKVGTIVYGQHRIPEGEKGLGEPYTKAGKLKAIGLATARECVVCGNLFCPKANTPHSRTCSSVCADNKKRGYCTGGCGAYGQFSNAGKCASCRGIIRSANGTYSALGVAVRAQDWEAIITELERHSILVDSCLVWNGRTNEQGYASVAVTFDRNQRSLKCHRLALAAKLTRELHQGEQAHHTCANRSCVNPDHIQLASAAENVGEMKARKTYEARIKFLEAEVERLTQENLDLREVKHGVNERGITCVDDQTQDE